MADGKIPQEFEIGEPVVVCRWRLSSGTLPAANRHLRALGWRTVLGEHPSKQLLSWAKQHIEWTLSEGSALHPDGVLMLMIDEEGRAAMAVGAYEPLPGDDLSALVGRARSAREEARLSAVAPEVLWAMRDGQLVCALAVGERCSGANSLVSDLARTLGMPVARDASLLDDLDRDPSGVDEAFLVSDEHGVVVACDASGDVGRRFRDGWERLLASANRPGGRAYQSRNPAN